MEKVEYSVGLACNITDVGFPGKMITQHRGKGDD